MKFATAWKTRIFDQSGMSSYSSQPECGTHRSAGLSGTADPRYWYIAHTSDAPLDQRSPAECRHARRVGGPDDTALRKSGRSGSGAGVGRGTSRRALRGATAAMATAGSRSRGARKGAPAATLRRIVGAAAGRITTAAARTMAAPPKTRRSEILTDGISVNGDVHRHAIHS